jgi:hypothetical protein
MVQLLATSSLHPRNNAPQEGRAGAGSMSLRRIGWSLLGVHNLPFPAHLLHTGQLYIRPLPDLDEQTRLRSWLIVLGGSMAASPSVTALPVPGGVLVARHPLASSSPVTGCTGGSRPARCGPFYVRTLLAYSPVRPRPRMDIGRCQRCVPGLPGPRLSAHGIESPEITIRYAIH